jgi:drug/metabolite transporter (DMT)-like permease
MSSRLSSWVILILLSLIWGSSFILMKRGLNAFSSDEVAALRISIAFLALLPLMIRHYHIDLKKYLKGIVIMGVFGNLIPAFLFTAAETRISSSLTGMLNSLTPLFTIMIGMAWMNLRPSKRQVIGVVVGLIAAVALIAVDPGGGGETQNFIYSGLVVIATGCYAISVNGIRRYLAGLNSVAATVWAFSFTGPVALIYLFAFTDAAEDIAGSTIALESLGYVTILAVMGSALALIFYNLLVKQAGVLFASSCTYLIPVVAILWGVWDGEAANMAQVASIGVIILGVYLINSD